MAGPGSADRAGPGHLPDHHEDALGTERSRRAGYSFYGFSFVYIIFDDGTDPYWARSRVLEYLSSLGRQLPAG